MVSRFIFAITKVANSPHQKAIRLATISHGTKLKTFAKAAWPSHPGAGGSHTVASPVTASKADAKKPIHEDIAEDAGDGKE